MPRTLRSLTAVAVSLAALVGLVATAPPAAAAVVRPIVFPVDGPVTMTATDDFGACRDGCTRRHQGNDLMGKKGLPLLSAVDGTVCYVQYDNVRGNYVILQDAAGYRYWYLHVNNDTPGTDDGKATRGQAFPSSIVAGATVRRGQVVGWLGDSGNAESTGAHLHFELHTPVSSGSCRTASAVSPRASLEAATRWASTQRWELRRTPTGGAPQDTTTYGVNPGDVALLCDWDGDSYDEAVIFRAGTWHLRSGAVSGTTQAQLAFGGPEDRPLCGNVDGDAADEPLLFRAGTWTVRSAFASGAGVAWTARYGLSAGDVPVLGDWDGNGRDDLGIFRAGGGWHLRSGAGATGRTTTSFTYGTRTGDRPASGDWNGDGRDEPAIYRAGEWHLRSSSAASASTKATFRFGTSADQPVTGRWVAGAVTGLGVFRPPST